MNHPLVTYTNLRKWDIDIGLIFVSQENRYTNITPLKHETLSGR